MMTVPSEPIAGGDSSEEVRLWEVILARCLEDLSIETYPLVI